MSELKYPIAKINLGPLTQRHGDAQELIDAIAATLGVKPVTIAAIITIRPGGHISAPYHFMRAYLEDRGDLNLEIERHDDAVVVSGEQLYEYGRAIDPVASTFERSEIVTFDVEDAERKGLTKRPDWAHKKVDLMEANAFAELARRLWPLVIGPIRTLDEEYGPTAEDIEWPTFDITKETRKALVALYHEAEQHSAIAATSVKSIIIEHGGIDTIAQAPDRYTVLAKVRDLVANLAATSNPNPEPAEVDTPTEDEDEPTTRERLKDAYLKAETKGPLVADQIKKLIQRHGGVEAIEISPDREEIIATAVAIAETMSQNPWPPYQRPNRDEK